MINDNLKILRNIFGISQRELGRRIHMSGQYIAKIENNERNPTLETLKKIVSVLDVELSELLERPRLTSEIFINKVNKEKISYNALLINSKLNDLSLKVALINDPIYSFNGYDYSLDDYYTVGLCLEFSKDFLEKRLDIDSNIRNLSNYDEYECITNLTLLYELWVNTFYKEYTSDLSQLVETINSIESNLTSKNDLEEFKSKYSEVPEFSLNEISEYFFSTLTNILKLASTSSILDYGLNDFNPDEIDELNNFIFNSFRLKTNEILERHKTSD